MFKYIKTAVDNNDISKAGIEALWNDNSSRQDIIRQISQLRGSEIVESLEKVLDEEEYDNVMMAIAQGVLS